jgi:hypothetical protein
VVLPPELPCADELAGLLKKLMLVEDKLGVLTSAANIGTGRPRQIYQNKPGYIRILNIDVDKIDLGIFDNRAIFVARSTWKRSCHM